MPEAFLWGTATSAHQIEGHNTHSDWWRWESDGRVESGEVSGSACDHRAHYREDLARAASLGCNSYRFSIEWAKIQPNAGRWEESELDWYESLVAECERLNLLPMATLQHFTLPAWVADEGGLTAPRFVDYFSEYCQRVLERLGSRVPLWCTVNEPVNLALGSYFGGYMPPGQRSPASTSKAISTLLQAHRRVYEICHTIGARQRNGPFKDYPFLVGLAHNMLDILPYREQSPVERRLAYYFDRFYNWSWIDACLGRPTSFQIPMLFRGPPDLSPSNTRPSLDFLGVNYYTKLHVGLGRFPYAEHTHRFCINVSFRKPEDKASDLDWAIHPSGFQRVLTRLKQYQLPLYITENGIADARDQYRSAYLRSHLAEVARAVSQGSDIRGYFHWSLLDNFEWIKGFAPRFGLFEVDYATQERRPRPSAETYQQIIAEHVQRAGIPPDVGLLE